MPRETPAVDDAFVKKRAASANGEGKFTRKHKVESQESRCDEAFEKGTVTDLTKYCTQKYPEENFATPYDRFLFLKTKNIPVVKDRFGTLGVEEWENPGVDYHIERGSDSRKTLVAVDDFEF